MAAAEWTLEELIDMVATVLDGTGYVGAPNGRVQDLPDARAIRWYASIGLMDRPGLRGRTRVYGPRHYLQLVAIKRRQAQGFKIAEIQAELANAPDELLLRIAKLPAGVAFRVSRSGHQRMLSEMTQSTAPPPRRFWVMPPSEFMPAEEPGRDRGPDGDHGEVHRGPDGDHSEVHRVPGRDHSEVHRGPDGDHGEMQRPGRQRGGGDGHAPAAKHGGEETPPTGSHRSHEPRPAESHLGHEPRPDERPGDGLISGVPLGGGVVLLLPSAPGSDDIARIREVTRELMGFLAVRGLVAVGGDETRRDGDAQHGEKHEADPAEPGRGKGNTAAAPRDDGHRAARGRGDDNPNEADRTDEGQEARGRGGPGAEGERRGTGRGKRRAAGKRVQDEIEDSTNAGAGRTKRRGSAV